MKQLAVTIFIILIVVTLGLYLVSFQVRETESALVTTFGKATRPITEPGWYFKWPPPIQQIYKFDSRERVFVPEVEETRTAGGEPLIVNTYIVWKISDPLTFFRRIITVQNAEEGFLRSRVRNSQNNVIGKHYFSEFINSDQSKMKFDDIQKEMLSNLQQSITGDEYGIEITSLGIKQFKVSQDVSQDVFARMKAERGKQVEKIKSEGKAEEISIKSNANMIHDVLFAAADARAKQIRGEGDARAATYYKMLDEQPRLAEFLRDLDALKKMLESRTTYVVPTDKPPFNLLRAMPELKPVEPNEPKK
jgi:modulator of FtsH protease HflC